MYVFSRFFYLIKELHSKLLIFSDFKPENVILDYDEDKSNYVLFLIDIGSVFIEDESTVPEAIKS